MCRFHRICAVDLEDFSKNCIVGYKLNFYTLNFNLQLTHSIHPVSI